MEAAATLGDEVIIKAGQDGRLDSAVLACADIDLYSRNLKSTRLRGAYSASKGLPTIQEKSIAEESLPQIEASSIPAVCNRSTEDQQAASMSGLSPVAEAPVLAGAFSRFEEEALPAIQGQHELSQGRSMKRSFSDPCSTEAALASKAKRHSRCLTETAAAQQPVKQPESRLKSMVQAAKPPARDKRRHKRVQSIDVTNDPTSCQLVATL